LHCAAVTTSPKNGALSESALVTKDQN
jgi:hypothetical protein